MFISGFPTSLHSQNTIRFFPNSLKPNWVLMSLQLDSWFDPRNRGVNKDAREVNSLIQSALIGTDIQLFNLTYLSEFRADAHPAIWLGKKDAVAIWGQDCMHWCLPGLPDTWVDILVARIMHYFQQGKHRKYYKKNWPFKPYSLKIGLIYRNKLEDLFFSKKLLILLTAKWFLNNEVCTKHLSCSLEFFLPPYVKVSCGSIHWFINPYMRNVFPLIY